MMYVREGPLLLRQAAPADAPVLHAWWNDGAVMAHAGFPGGPEITENADTGRMPKHILFHCLR
jgi:hypothetical protein